MSGEPGDTTWEDALAAVLAGDEMALDALVAHAPAQVAAAVGPLRYLIDLGASSELDAEERAQLRACLTRGTPLPRSQQRWFREELTRAWLAEQPTPPADGPADVEASSESSDETPPTGGPQPDDPADRQAAPGESDNDTAPPAADPADGDAPPEPVPVVDARHARFGKGFTRFAEVMGLVTAVPVAIVFVWTSLFHGNEPPRTLDADIGVVVAEFSTASDDEVVGVEDLSMSFSNDLDDELARRAEQPAADGSTLSVEVRSSAEVAPIAAEPPAAMIAGAQEVAADHEADAVITAAVSEDRRTVTPYLYLPPDAVPDAVPLAGLHPLGGPITTRIAVDDNLAARATVRGELTERARGVAELLVGLHRYGNGQYEDAERRFESALEVLPSDVDRGIAWLFLGNTSLKRKDFGEARERYQKGLAIDTEVAARLELGLAEVVFHEAIGECSADAEREEVLTDLRAQYDQILATADARVGDVFLDRTRFGLARVQVCLATMGLPAWDQAAEIYAQLARSGEQSDGETRDLVSESLAGLGFIAGQQPEISWDEDICADASACYTRAAEVAIDPERAQTFRRQADEHEDG